MLGVALLIAFCVIETKVPQPMFRLQLFKIRAFTSGVLASFLAALSRGGLMFMLIIWLQGIWLPLHGYAFSVTPLWAGIAMLPLTLGFLIAGPVVGHPVGPLRGPAVRHRRHGRRRHLLRPARVPARRLPLLGVRRAPALHRPDHGRLRLAQPGRGDEQPAAPAPGAGSGMNTTFQNSAQVLSIGIFFTLMIVGLMSSLPQNLLHGLVAHGVPTDVAERRRPPLAGVDAVRRLPRATTPSST